MKVDQFNVGRDAANGHVTIGTGQFFPPPADDSGNVSAMTILIVTSPTQSIDVVNDPIMPLRVLQIVYTMDATIEDMDSHTNSHKPGVPGIVCQPSYGSIVHLIGDGSIRRHIHNIRIIRQRSHTRRRECY